MNLTTQDEAEERAIELWGPAVTVEPAPYEGITKWMVWTADGELHSLDAGGHATCHDDCQKPCEENDCDVCYPIVPEFDTREERDGDR
jgi:hypothetical protein